MWSQTKNKFKHLRLYLQKIENLEDIQVGAHVLIFAAEAREDPRSQSKLLLCCSRRTWIAAKRACQKDGAPYVSRLTLRSHSLFKNKQHTAAVFTKAI